MRRGRVPLLFALCGLCVGFATWSLAGGPAVWILLVAAAGGAVVGVVTEAVAGDHPRAWRWPVAIGVGALAGGTAIWIAGRPEAENRGAVAAGVLAALAAVLAATWVWRSGGSARRGAHGDPLASVVDRVARPVPADEMLQQVVDALRQGPGRRAAELWQVEDDALVLTHRSPLVDRVPAGLPPEAAAVAANAGVVGGAWLHTWIPSLLVEDDPGSERVRAVPLASQGDLAGFVVLRRAEDDPAFGPIDDERLLRLQRPVAAALNQQRLTAALERSVRELRDRNAELQASRTRLVSVADAERRRLERDLHDGAQAQLTALGVRLQLVRRLVGDDPGRVDELLQSIEADLAEVTAELRALAHGIVPPLLLTGGLGDALRGVASKQPIDVHVDVPGTERYRPEVEAAVYYCCVEALQNAVKHAGPGATATVEVQRAGERLHFSVGDDGRGLPVGAPPCGQGIVNMSDRIGALGGSVAVGPGAGGTGVAVVGQVPVDPDDVAAR